jgi:hypothetical protein
VGDAAFHGHALVTEGSTWTTRLPSNAVLYGPKPPPTGRRGRPREKGHRLGTCADIAKTAIWQTVRVTTYGQTITTQTAVVDALWYGSFKGAAGRVVLVKAADSTKPYDLALFTLDGDVTDTQIAQRYSWRWPIEPSNATGKKLMGVGDAHNRLERAVERTVPFGFLIQSLLIVWYARHGYAAADVTARRLLWPWYRPRPSPPPRTCSPSYAASSSRPGFRPYDQVKPALIKSRPAPGPAVSPPHSSETRVPSSSPNSQGACLGRRMPGPRESPREAG